MKRFGRLLALAVMLSFAVGTLSYAADPAPPPSAPTDEKGKPKPGPSGPKLFENEKKDEKKDEKGGK